MKNLTELVVKTIDELDEKIVLSAEELAIAETAFKAQQKAHSELVSEKFYLDSELERMKFVFNQMNANDFKEEKYTNFPFASYPPGSASLVQNAPREYFQIKKEDEPIELCLFDLYIHGPADKKPTIRGSKLRKVLDIKQDRIELEFIHDVTKYRVKFKGSRPNKKGEWTTYYAEEWAYGWPLPVYQIKNLLCKFSSVKILPSE